MIEYKLRMSTWYSLIGFGPPGDDHVGIEDTDKLRQVGSLLILNIDRAGGFAVITATHTGYVNVSNRSWAVSEIVAAAPEDWEDSATASFESPTGELIAQNTGMDGDMSPNLLDGAGLYAFGILARGRDGAPPADLNATGSDAHFLNLWPIRQQIADRWMTRSRYGGEVETW